MPDQEPVAFERGWQKRFRGFAEAKDDDAGIAGWSANGLACRLRSFSRLWRRGAGDTVWLDAGSGAGTYSRFLVSNQVQVLALDYSLPTVQKGRKRSGPGIRWVLGDITRLPLAPGRFDGALCFGVLQALARSDDAVSELARSVKLGGEVWIDALNAWCLPQLLERLRRTGRGAPMHLRYEYPRRLRRIMRQQGLKSIRLYWIPILPQQFSRFQPLLEIAPVRWILRWVPLMGTLLSHAFIVRGRRA